MLVYILGTFALSLFHFKEKLYSTWDFSNKMKSQINQENRMYDVYYELT